MMCLEEKKGVVRTRGGVCVQVVLWERQILCYEEKL